MTKGAQRRWSCPTWRAGLVLRAAVAVRIRNHVVRRRILQREVEPGDFCIFRRQFLRVDQAQLGQLRVVICFRALTFEDAHAGTNFAACRAARAVSLAMSRRNSRHCRACQRVRGCAASRSVSWALKASMRLTVRHSDATRRPNLLGQVIGWCLL